MVVSVYQIFIHEIKFGLLSQYVSFILLKDSGITSFPLTYIDTKSNVEGSDGTRSSTYVAWMNNVEIHLAARRGVLYLRPPLGLPIPSPPFSIV